MGREGPREVIGVAAFNRPEFHADISIARLRTASILLINIKALANEIAKNLVLAGVGSLTILDDQNVGEDDLGAQFLVSEQHLGSNVFSSTTALLLLLTYSASRGGSTPNPKTKPKGVASH